MLSETYVWSLTAYRTIAFVRLAAAYMRKQIVWLMFIVGGIAEVYDLKVWHESILHWFSGQGTSGRAMLYATTFFAISVLASMLLREPIRGGHDTSFVDSLPIPTTVRRQVDISILLLLNIPGFLFLVFPFIRFASNVALDPLIIKGAAASMLNLLFVQMAIIRRRSFWCIIGCLIFLYRLLTLAGFSSSPLLLYEGVVGLAIVVAILSASSSAATSWLEKIRNNTASINTVSTLDTKLPLALACLLHSHRRALLLRCIGASGISLIAWMILRTITNTTQFSDIFLAWTFMLGWCVGGLFRNLRIEHAKHSHYTVTLPTTARYLPDRDLVVVTAIFGAFYLATTLVFVATLSGISPSMIAMSGLIVAAFQVITQKIYEAIDNGYNGFISFLASWLGAIMMMMMSRLI